jgi:hypothetical protein
MKLKLMDLVLGPKRKLTGQTCKIRSNVALIRFVTDDIVSIDISKIIWNKDHWRIND